MVPNFIVPSVPVNGDLSKHPSHPHSPALLYAHIFCFSLPFFLLLLFVAVIFTAVAIVDDIITPFPYELLKEDYETFKAHMEEKADRQDDIASSLEGVHVRLEEAEANVNALSEEMEATTTEIQANILFSLRCSISTVFRKYFMLKFVSGTREVLEY